MPPSSIPPELVENILFHAWNKLTTSCHQHAYQMTRWMLVNRDWLKMVISLISRDVWITSSHQFYYLKRIHHRQSVIWRLAGISDVGAYLADTTRSLTILVFHDGSFPRFAGHYNQLLHYATTEPRPARQLSFGRTAPKSTVPVFYTATLLRDYFPKASTLHFIFVDCVPNNYTWWDTSRPSARMAQDVPESLKELHVTHVYSSPPPALLYDAPQGTFFPPPNPDFELPTQCSFASVTRLVVREANADFVAFLVGACPKLQVVETTADFEVHEGDRRMDLAIVRLERDRPVLSTISESLSNSEKRQSSIWQRVIKNAVRRKRYISAQY